MRFGDSTPKQFIEINGVPLLFHTLAEFLKHPGIAEIIIAAPEDWLPRLEREIDQRQLSGRVKLVAGGARRQDSVKNAVAASDPANSIILIHDAGRPFVTAAMISASIAECTKVDGGVIIALPASDTVKQVQSATKNITQTLDRESIWLSQTPQTFHRPVLIKALEAAEREAIAGTDEAALIERLGYTVKVLPGSPLNIKITTPEDGQYARIILGERND